MAIDLSSIDLKAEGEDGSFCHLYDPRTGEYLYDEDGKTEVGLFVKSIHSSTARNIVNRMARKNQGKQKPKRIATLDDQEVESAEFLSELTTGWQAVQFNGKDKFAKDVALELYRERPWIMSQVNQHAGNAANFIRKS